MSLQAEEDCIEEDFAIFEEVFPNLSFYVNFADKC